MTKAKKMPCEYCNGTVHTKRVRDDYWSEGELVIIENVPVGVCNRCGERYYDADVLERMEHIASQRKKIKRKIQVPIASFEVA